MLMSTIWAYTLVLLSAVKVCCSVKRTQRIRMFWIRHGQSCANVMDACKAGPESTAEMLPALQVALDAYSDGRGGAAQLSSTYGIQAAAAWTDGDCTAEVLGTGSPSDLAAGRTIIRLHDIYQDPSLTTCATSQSRLAGMQLLRWFNESGIELQFIGSSFLKRAIQTAHMMFVAPCKEGAACNHVMDGAPTVTPLPYFTERAAAGTVSIQADNIPHPFDFQMKMLRDVYRDDLSLDNTYAAVYPRLAQHFEKFKAFLAAEVVAPGSTHDLTKLGRANRFPEQRDRFRRALEEAMSDAMHLEDHTKPVSFDWDGGSYSAEGTFLREDYEALKDAPEINIAVVGHSQMMKEYCQSNNPPKPANNAVLEKLFILESETLETESGEPATHLHLRELAGNCKLVMDAPPGSHQRFLGPRSCCCSTGRGGPA
eukprot:TRINITY_DN38537_c0_g1_i2.p1 TRINITY_DN38537_c0_g1~~TRINITY_DN38537_c0_g1_i2.p1  ORF type:complete len:426 (+),score=51.86 TRINITY_DN38537_c0_g1_i2:53-1330(+)